MNLNNYSNEITIMQNLLALQNKICIKNGSINKTPLILYNVSNYSVCPENTIIYVQVITRNQGQCCYVNQFTILKILINKSRLVLPLASSSITDRYVIMTDLLHYKLTFTHRRRVKGIDARTSDFKPYNWNKKVQIAERPIPKPYWTTNGTIFIWDQLRMGKFASTWQSVNSTFCAKSFWKFEFVDYYSQNVFHQSPITDASVPSISLHRVILLQRNLFCNVFCMEILSAPLAGIERNGFYYRLSIKCLTVTVPFFSYSTNFRVHTNVCLMCLLEELNGPAVSALSVRSRKLSNVLKG
jgi:hypothetical protein